MAVTVTKNPKESSERLISRFTREVQQSRLILAVRDKRYRKKKISKMKVRKAALKRDEYRAKQKKEKFTH